MKEEKFGNLLTAILIVVVIILFALIGFFAFQTLTSGKDNKEAATFVNKYVGDQTQDSTSSKNEEVENNTEITDIPIIDTSENPSTSTQTTSTTKKQQYKGFNVVGTIRIPAINLSYPILEKATTKSIETSVAVIYGPGPNQIGNTCIVGHNYRDGSFFGKNDKLKLGDKVYIKDPTGTEIKYNIYNIYNTSPEDGDYMIRNTNGKREISLSTCTDNSKERLIIWAVEE